MVDSATAITVFELRPNWAGRVKAFGLAAAWLALWAALLAATSYGLVRIGLLPAAMLHSGNPPGMTPGDFELAHMAVALVTVVATVFMAWITREKLTRLGFARSGVGRDLAIGLITGLMLMTGTLALMAAVGVFAFGPVVLPASRIAFEAMRYVPLFVLVGVAEELWFRSFTLVQLSRALSFWPAAVLTSGVFALSHTANIGENPSGLFAAGAGGLVLAYSFRRTGALWFAIGFHAAWDYAESFLFGAADSGGVLPIATLMRPSIHGPYWLTGGTAGPEGSVLVYVALFFLALIVRFVLPDRSSRIREVGEG
jgi:membrane protease YdiL (CAAX protease family)